MNTFQQALAGKISGGTGFTQALAAAEAQKAPAGPVVRSYAPGYRPWVAFSGTPSTSAGMSTAAMALVAGAGVLVIGGLAISSLLGWYVGRKLGTNWGWFWGLGGPVGLALMQGYREYGTGEATPNRRRHGRRRSRRRGSARARRGAARRRR